MRLRCSISRGIDEVFRFVVDPANLPLWRAAVVRAEWAEGSGPELGGTGTIVRSSFGMELAVSFRVVEFEEPTRIAIEVDSGLAVLRATTRFIAANQSTTLDHRLKLTSNGPYRLMAPALRSMVEHEERADISRLKAVLEGDG